MLGAVKYARSNRLLNYAQNNFIVTRGQCHYITIIGSKGADRMANLVASDQLVVLGAYQMLFWEHLIYVHNACTYLTVQKLRIK